MRKISFALTILIAFGFSALQAQISDKIVPHMGFMLEYPQAYVPGTNDASGSLPSYYSFNIGAYMALAQKNDIISVGPQANLQLGGNFIPLNNRLRFAYHFQVPVYAMVRVGANSTPYNQQAVGLAVGLGGSFNALSYYDRLTGGIIGNSRINYFNPAAVVEIHISTRGQELILRGHTSLLRDVGVFPQHRDLNGDLLPVQPGAQDLGYIGIGVVSSL